MCNHVQLATYNTLLITGSLKRHDCKTSSLRKLNRHTNCYLIDKTRLKGDISKSVHSNRLRGINDLSVESDLVIGSKEACLVLTKDGLKHLT